MPEKPPLAKTKADTADRVNLGKLEKIFKVIAMLKGGRWTARQLMDRMDLSKSSVYRYIELLDNVGFCIEKDFHDRYFMVTTDDDPLPSQFTVEEMTMLRTLIQVDSSHPLKSSVLKKISMHSEMDNMPKLFLKAHLGALVEQLTHAMRNKHQVVLKNYHSASSNNIGDRHIEPIHFSDNYGTIIALDLNDFACKQFKLDRMGEVLETHKGFTSEHLHEKRATDIFGLAGTGTTLVTLNLSVRAYLLLREEYPMAQAYLKSESGAYTFHGPVANFAGIGRFVLGLIDEIEIVEPVEFRKYVMEKVARARVQ